MGRTTKIRKEYTQYITIAILVNLYPSLTIILGGAKYPNHPWFCNWATLPQTIPLVQNLNSFMRTFFFGTSYGTLQKSRAIQQPFSEGESWGVMAGYGYNV